MSWREVRDFLVVESVLNDEWQAGVTIRLFRTGQWLYRTRTRTPLHALAWRVWVFADRVWFGLMLGADIPARLECGIGMRFAHGGRGVVLHPRVEFGERCTLYHAVTVGLRGESKAVPVFGDDVTLGAGCVVLGAARIADGAAIGPNAVVLDDVADGGHVVAARSVLLSASVDLARNRPTASGRMVPRQPDVT